MTFAAALREALEEEMIRDERVFILGQDIKYSLWGVTGGMQNKFGEERVRHAPISENGFVSAGVGAAIAGMRPVIELMFGDFILLAADAIFNQAAKYHYFNGGQFTVPLTIRVAGTGGGRGGGCHHSQSLESIATHFPGIKVVAPSNPADAKGLLKTAIRDDNPVVFFEHKLMYSVEGEVPEGEHLVPIGKAEVIRQGTDATVVSFSIALQKTLEAAKKLSDEDGIEIEVINLRTLLPIDKQTIFSSLEKTNRLAVVEECHKTLGMGAELSALIAEEVLHYLDAPIKRIAAYNVPLPGSRHGESVILPTVDRIYKTVKALVGEDV